MEKNITTTRSGVAAPGQLQLDLGTDFHFQHVADALPGISLRSTRRPRTKLATVLRLFVMGRNMNRFEAEAHNDHCLHSTVSTLQNGYGIQIEREFEKVPCLRGRETVPVKRYWLGTRPENITAARALLDKMDRRA
jgi:hypothetical protein